MKRFFALLSAAVLLGGLCGCAGMENVENSKKLRVGMTKAQVQQIMGEPLAGETFCTPDVWFYQIQTVWADGLTTEDECMPLVFKDGKLAGWGTVFYTHFRQQKVSEAQAATPEKL
ncbi:MAG: DUF3192 domain-containing protein [Lentisphaeria bacterium]|nr:DUF3192 domain-containing protein [Lentisphaeria bacterium]MBQ8755311.1 DUF3192 domain-containing protein [Lentisphaeria bacterium]